MADHDVATEIALLRQSVESMDKTNGESHVVLFDMVDCVQNSIKGKDNKPGIMTRIALAEASLGRMWWWLGSISLTILIACLYIIRDHIA